MRLRRIASRVLTIAALAAVPALAGCGASGSHHTAAPQGKIERLREAQEKAQSRIEAEGRRNALQAQREQQATRVQAEGELDDRTVTTR